MSPVVLSLALLATPGGAAPASKPATPVVTPDPSVGASEPGVDPATAAETQRRAGKRGDHPHGGGRRCSRRARALRGVHPRPRRRLHPDGGGARRDLRTGLPPPRKGSSSPDADPHARSTAADPQSHRPCSARSARFDSGRGGRRSLFSRGCLAGRDSSHIPPRGGHGGRRPGKRPPPRARVIRLGASPALSASARINVWASGRVCRPATSGTRVLAQHRIGVRPHGGSSSRTSTAV